MTITWLGHACFALESGGYRIVIDPFCDVPGFPDTDTSAHKVCCTHGHFDHSYTQGITVLPETSCPFSIHTVDTFHDDREGALRGTNKVHCFAAEGLTVVHLGDLGHTLSEEQIAAIGSCDVLLLPIGGTYTVTAAEARDVAAQLHPRIIIPMHYQGKDFGFPVLTTVEEFLSLFPTELTRRYDSNTFTLTADIPAQIAVLSC